MSLTGSVSFLIGFLICRSIMLRGIQGKLKCGSGCADPGVIGALSNILQVAERTEARVDRLDQQQLALLNASEYGVFFCDCDGYNTFVSAPYGKLLGVPASKLEGHGWRNYVAGGDAGRLAYDEDWQRAFQSEVASQIPVRLIRGEGSEAVEFDAVVRTVAITTKGHVAYYLGIVSRA